MIFLRAFFLQHSVFFSQHLRWSCLRFLPGPEITNNVDHPNADNQVKSMSCGSPVLGTKIFLRNLKWKRAITRGAKSVWGASGASGVEGRASQCSSGSRGVHLAVLPLDWKSFEGRADISCPGKYLRPRPLIFVFGGLKKAGDIFLIGKVKQGGDWGLKMPGHPELRLTLPGNKLTISSNSSNSISSKSSALSAHVVAKRLEQASSIYSQVITVWSAPCISNWVVLTNQGASRCKERPSTDEVESNEWVSASWQDWLDACVRGLGWLGGSLEMKCDIVLYHNTRASAIIHPIKWHKTMWGREVCFEGKES